TGALAEPVAIAPPVEEIIDRTVGTHLILRNGMAEIHINGTVVPPVLFFGNLDPTANRPRVLSEVRHAAQNGIHLHSTLVELPCPLSEAAHALEEIDNRLRALLDADPEGFVMPRIVFVPARGWKREYPTEIASYADGTTGDPSLTSERFWREAEHSLTLLVTHLQEYEWGKRVFGYHLERGEWFQPADQGYDRSMANRDAFRDWLREKYKHNLVSLRAAWYDGDVQFHTADIPPLITKPNPLRAFFETRRERRIIDFFEFTSESTAKRLISLAQAVKRAAHHQALVSVCYGYTFEFGHGFSGHLALGTLLASPAIDLVCGPPSYRDRKSGGGASIPAPVESFPLHGKLWLSEDDTKTYLAPAQQDPEDFNPRLGDRFSTEQAQHRAQGRALAHTTGIGFMDLWGEGWLDEEGLWERLGAFTARYRAFMQHRMRARVPEVVALVDEKSLLHIQRGEAFFRKLTNGLRDTLQRAGVSYGTYLQSDLLAPDFPTEAKLYLFLTPYRLSPEHRIAIREKLQGEGRTLAWLYAPGSCEERPSVGGALEEAATHIVGMSLRPQEWNSEVGSRIIEPHHVVTERLSGREIGTRERLNPSFYVDDEEATTLAEYQGSGLPSIAVKNCGDWKSVFIGEPTLPLELLRGICRYAGAHVWASQGDDVMEIGGGWVTVHANREGQRTLRLPDALTVYDLSEGRVVGDALREHRFFLRNGMTRTLCVGPLERMEQIGLPNLTSPVRDRPKLPLEPLPERPPKREPAALPKPRSSDLETLEAVLNMDISAMEALELEALEGVEAEFAPDSAVEESASPSAATEDAADGEMIANGRRRRRRGGRGRGRRRTETEGAEGGEPIAALPESAEADGVEADGVEAQEQEEEEGPLPFPPFPVPPEPPRVRTRNPLFVLPGEEAEGAEQESDHAESAAEHEGDAGL
ncbi:MAG TPA: hypothetical protein VKU00_21780, partial [Chthonomonadaceae bacterium]|nr:hypothetical protein [Chthonomonadaceae bacterium]